MAILFCEKAESRDANVNLEEKTFSMNVNISFSRTYVILGNGVSEAQLNFVGCEGIPRVGTTSDEFNTYLSSASSTLFEQWIHSGSQTGSEYYKATQPLPTGYLVRSASAKEVENIFWGTNYSVAWEVQVTMDNTLADKQDPESIPREVSWDTEKEQLALVRDVINGNAVATAVGEPMSAEFTHSISLLTIKKYYSTSSFSPQATKLAYEDTVCNTAFWGWSAYHAYMDTITSNLVERENYAGQKTYYWEVTYKIKFKTDGTTQPWQIKLMHQGTRYFDAKGKVIEYVGEQGGSGTGLINLTADGHLLPDNGAINYRVFNAYRTVSWASLHIGESDT